jgi:hypothetical protein
LVVAMTMINSLSCGNSTQSRINYCVYNRDCDNGTCNNGVCECYPGYTTWGDDKPCSYKQFEQLTAVLLSFFFGCDRSDMSTFDYRSF